jgi:hypothetical protein
VSELVSFSLSLKSSTGAIFSLAGELSASYGKNLQQRSDVAHTYFSEPSWAHQVAVQVAVLTYVAHLSRHMYRMRSRTR